MVPPYCGATTTLPVTGSVTYCLSARVAGCSCSAAAHRPVAARTRPASTARHVLCVTNLMRCFSSSSRAHDELPPLARSRSRPSMAGYWKSERASGVELHPHLLARAQAPAALLAFRRMRRNGACRVIGEANSPIGRRRRHAWIAGMRPTAPSAATAER